MKNFAIVLSVLLLLPVFLFSTDITAGNVSGIWNAAGSPYNILGDISISPEDQLQIEAGVQVIFSDFYSLTVNGRLLAEGTETDSVEWKAANTTAGWHGIRFMNTNNNTLEASELNYCRFLAGFAIAEGEGQNGGAIYCSNSSALSINNSYFYQNYAAYDGGAICLKNGSDIQINDCLFLDNSCYFYGAGVMAYASNPVINRCTFKLNSSSVFAGGFCSWDEAEPEIYNSTFINNEAGAVAGIYCVNSTVKLANILFIGNETSFGAGGACGLTNSTTEATNITAVNNISPLSGGAFWVNGGTLTLHNSILTDNTPENIFVLDGACNAYNSLIRDGFEGTNILTCDPAFVDLNTYNLQLSEISLCIDSGDISELSLTLPEFDLLGNIRLLDGDLDGTITVDMGAYEYVPTVSTTGFITGTVTNTEGAVLENATINAGTYSTTTNSAGEYSLEVEAGLYTVFCTMEGYVEMLAYSEIVLINETTIVDFVLELAIDADEDVVNALSLLSNYPNPFNPETTISFYIPAGESADLLIYNTKGEIVNSYNNLSSSQKNLVWHGVDSSGNKVSSGIYLYQLRGKDKIQTKKMMLLK